MENVNFLAYRNAVKQAWKDGKVTPSELTTLETVRNSLNITPEEHNQIEEEVKTELEAQGIKFEKPAMPADDEDEPAEIPEEQLLLDAGKKAYDNKQYEKAVDYFYLLTRKMTVRNFIKNGRYPNFQRATRPKLMNFLARRG